MDYMLEEMYQPAVDIIDLMADTLDEMGIVIDMDDGEFMSFQYDSWPCICNKVSPYAMKIMLYLYQSDEIFEWSSDELRMHVYDHVSRYWDYYSEHIIVGGGNVFMLSYLSPPYGENPVRQIKYQLQRFLSESLSRAKEFILENKFLRDALGQDAHWGWDTPQDRISKMDCWTDVRQYTEGLAGVADKEGRYGFLDAEAKLVIPCRWGYVQPFAEGLAAVEDETGYYGFINRKGRVVIPCEWSRADWFSEGRAAVMDAEGEWGYINSLAELVIPCTWAEAEDFHNGRARVWDSEHKPYIIDIYGHIVSAEL
ncbi:MAG: WG repeat-containing protein [Prevotella sp.]|nr:WG repeat-containing protein [Prevotella sp.]